MLETTYARDILNFAWRSTEATSENEYQMPRLNLVLFYILRRIYKLYLFILVFFWRFYNKFTVKNDLFDIDVDSAAPITSRVCEIYVMIVVEVVFTLFKIAMKYVKIMNIL